MLLCSIDRRLGKLRTGLLFDLHVANPRRRQGGHGSGDPKGNHGSQQSRQDTQEILETRIQNELGSCIEQARHCGTWFRQSEIGSFIDN